MINKPTILCWNCRGVQNAQFLPSLRELVQLHEPTIIAILAPRIYGWTADDLYKKMGKSVWFQVEASGFSDGIWILWNKLDANLRIINARQQFMHPSVLSLAGAEWELIAVYASLNPSYRARLREGLKSIETSRPWQLIGDFNAV